MKEYLNVSILEGCSAPHLSRWNYCHLNMKPLISNKLNENTCFLFVWLFVFWFNKSWCNFSCFRENSVVCSGSSTSDDSIAAFIIIIIIIITNHYRCVCEIILLFSEVRICLRKMRHHSNDPLPGYFAHGDSSPVNAPCKTRNSCKTMFGHSGAKRCPPPFHRSARRSL